MKNKPRPGTGKKTKKTARRSKNPRPKKANRPAPQKVVRPPLDYPVLFLMFIIIAIPVIGATGLMQGMAWVMRLSFLLPMVPLLLILAGHNRSIISVSTQPVNWVPWGMLLLGFVSAFWATNHYVAVVGVVKWLYVVLISIAVYSLVRDKSDAQKKVMLACALGGGYMALIGVTQYLFGHEIYITPIGQYPWPSATSGHKNMASQLVGMTLPFALYLSLTVKKPWHWLANPLVALMLAYIVYGRARQVFVAVFVQLMILLVVLAFRRTRRLLKPVSFSKDYVISAALSALLLVALVLAPPFNKPFSWDKTAVGEFKSRTEVFTKQDATMQEISNGRYATWKITEDMIRGNPVGVGLNNWTVHYPRYNADSVEFYRSQKNDLWGEAHNDYLQLLAELGLPFVLLGIFMLLGLYKAYRCVLTTGDETSQRRAVFVGMSVMGLLTVMMFSFPLTKTATPAYLGVCLGLLSALVAMSSSAKPEKQFSFNPVILVVLLAMSVTGGVVGYREVSGWHESSIAKVISQIIFAPGADSNVANRSNMLLLGKHTDEAMRFAPYTPILLRESILAYTNISLSIDHERLAGQFRQKAHETAIRHLDMSPNEAFIHKLVGTRMQVPDDEAIEHIGRAIALNPDDLELYEDLKRIILPANAFDKAIGYYEHYIPRFYNQKMNSDYAYIGTQLKQQQRVIDNLQKIDLARRFAPESAEFKAAENNINQLIKSLKATQGRQQKL